MDCRIRLFLVFPWSRPSMTGPLPPQQVEAMRPEPGWYCNGTTASRRFPSLNAKLWSTSAQGSTARINSCQPHREKTQPSGELHTSASQSACVVSARAITSIDIWMCQFESLVWTFLVTTCYQVNAICCVAPTFPDLVASPGGQDSPEGQRAPESHRECSQET